MAVPKRKTSKSRRDMRRTHKKLHPIQLAECSQCGEKRLPHHACPSCGTYKGREVIEGKED